MLADKSLDRCLRWSLRFKLKESLQIRNAGNNDDIALDYIS